MKNIYQRNGKKSMDFPQYNAFSNDWFHTIIFVYKIYN